MHHQEKPFGINLHEAVAVEYDEIRLVCSDFSNLINTSLFIHIT